MGKDINDKRIKLEETALALFTFFMGMGGGLLSPFIYIFYRLFLIKNWHLKFDLYSILLLIGFLMSVIFSEYRIFSLQNFLVFFFMYIVYSLLRTSNIARESSDRIFDYWLFGSTLLAFGGMVGYLYSGVYADTPFMGKNGIGTLLATAVPISQVKLCCRGKLYDYLSFILITATLLLSMSQGAWIGLFLAEILLFVFGDKKIRKSILILAFLLIVLFFIFSVHSFATGNRFLDFFYTRLDMTSNSKVDRIYIWRSSIKMFLDHPITGVGLGTFSLEYPDYILPGAREIIVSFAHNLPLNLLVETGIVGFLTFFSFLIYLYRRCLSSLKISKDNFYLMLLSSLTAYIGHQLFDGTMWSLHIGIVFWLLGALILNFNEKS